MLFSHLFNQPAHLSCQALAASCLPHGISACALALVPARARLLCAHGGQQSHWHQAKGMERGSAAPQEQSMARQAPPALGRPAGPVPQWGPSAGSLKSLQTQQTLAGFHQPPRLSHLCQMFWGRGAKSGSQEINPSALWLRWHFAWD